MKFTALGTFPLVPDWARKLVPVRDRFVGRIAFRSGLRSGRLPTLRAVRVG
jgi:hypothetical protein